MAGRDNTAEAPKAKAPGPSVVEALGNSISGNFASLAVKDATEAYHAKLTADGRNPDAMESLKLSVLDAHWRQLATATTPVVTS